MYFQLSLCVECVLEKMVKGSLRNENLGKSRQTLKAHLDEDYKIFRYLVQKPKARSGMAFV